MKKRIIAGLATGLFALTTVGVSATGAEAVVYKNYANCTALHKVYRNGVAKSTAAAHKQKYKPYVNYRLYMLNKGKDRDKDGTACERS
jgi:hypothetical protein